jgi:hypothetical protein
MAEQPVAGTTLGLRHSHSGWIEGKIVHVPNCRSPAGPAENAFVFVEIDGSRSTRARYLTWINLYDIEHAGNIQPARWSLCEPPEPFEGDVEWMPLGWGDDPFPSVAD